MNRADGVTRDDRALADRQAALVAALVCGSPAPPGFDAAGVALTARTLVRKRWAAVRRHWPVATADVIGGDAAAAADDFAAWAGEHRASGGLPLGGYADGFAFLTWLEAAGRLPPVAAAELALARLTWVWAPGPPARLVRRAWRGVARAHASGVSGGITATAWGTAAHPRRTSVR